MQRKHRDQVDGYIVKLYEKIASVPQQTSDKDAMFLIWMNFDYMDVIPVSDFHDFGKSLDAHDLKDREKFQSRQKMFIYPLGEDQGLILGDSVLKDAPLITLTFLDLERPLDMGIASDESSLQAKMIDCIECKNNVKGQLYGSLSIYDYVLVLRGKTYAELGQILSDYQKSLKDKNILLNKTYTIQGIDIKHSSSWKEEPDSDVSIRVSCKSYISSDQFYSDPVLKEALQEKYQVFSLMGKYDYDIMGKIKDTSKFIEFLGDSGEPSNLKKEIFKTNTRFMNLELDVENVVTKDLGQGSSEMSLKDDLDQWIESYLELNGLCPSIKESLLRLILRISQAITVVSRSGMKEDLRDLLFDFLAFLKIHQYEPENQDEFGEMINCINLLLDNRITAGMADFEMPHNVLRYSGADLKVLLAYSKYTDKLFSILQSYRRRETGSLKYVHLVTTGTGAKITATLYLGYCEQYRFININIPVNMLFEAQYVLPWITHEVGHFIRAGWKRCDRNAAYWKSVSRVLADKLYEYTNTDRLADFRNDIFLEQMADDLEGKKFDIYRENVYQYCQEIITKGVYGYKKSILIPYNHVENLMDKIEEITQILQKVYEESIADIFMIRVLGIKSLAEYLCIQNAYYHHINVDVRELPLQNISRIMAVSIIIEKLDIQEHNQIENHFQDVYRSCYDENILPIMKQMKEFKNYYFLEPLISFIKEQVEKGLNQLLENDELFDICHELRKSYNSLRRGDFKPFREFVEGV